MKNKSSSESDIPLLQHNPGILDASPFESSEDIAIEVSPSKSSACDDNQLLERNKRIAYILYAIAIIIIYAIFTTVSTSNADIAASANDSDAYDNNLVASTEPYKTVTKLFSELSTTSSLEPSAVPSSVEMIEYTLFDDVNSTEYKYLHDTKYDNSRIRNVTVSRLQTLLDCLQTSSCSKNQKTVVILGTQQFRDFLLGSVSGEAIWAGSMLAAGDELGFTMLPADSPEEALTIYHMIGNLTRLVILENPLVGQCWRQRTNATFHCVATPEHPDDIPIWKMMAPVFWPGCDHPLGDEWCIVPENYHSWEQFTHNTYVGYSIEKACTKIPYVPWSERQNRTFILAKQVQYFLDLHVNLTVFDTLSSAERKYPIKFYTTYENNTNVTIPGVTNLAWLPRQRFMTELSLSKALIGLGNPRISPSPWDALCLGVPFFNPILGWDKTRPYDRSKWHTQHDGVKYLMPPYVYNFFEDDTETLMSLLERAMTNELPGRFIPRHMTNSEMLKRFEKFVTKNWRARGMKEKEVHAEFGGEDFVRRNKP
ncbi:hypothetical protein HDU84_001592 [Entophlyctis sp. JEL0112]|nr:hypothetical protein HDU84_001592 [Entophlyctis sp. JEL0112]